MRIGPNLKIGWLPPVPFVIVNTTGPGPRLTGPMSAQPVELRPNSPLRSRWPWAVVAALVYLAGMVPVILQPAAVSMQLTAKVPEVTPAVMLLPASV